jgi:serine/threonine protein kinase
MAPEQFERAPLDARTDLYALGCVYYFALTAHYPFIGDGLVETIASHLRHDLAPVRSHRPDLPVPLADWLMKLVSLNPAHRPADAATALQGLRTAAQAAGLVTKASAPLIIRRSRRRFSSLWGVGAGALILALGWAHSWHGRGTWPCRSPRRRMPPRPRPRSGSSPASPPVTVLYSINGSARNGADYDHIEPQTTLKAARAPRKSSSHPPDRTPETAMTAMSD